jgi:hypothetical protein
MNIGVDAAANALTVQDGRYKVRWYPGNYLLKRIRFCHLSVSKFVHV